MPNRVQATISTAFAALFLIIMSGCDGDSATDNGRLRVFNDTDKDIVIYYDQDTRSGIDSVTKLIPAAQSKVIHIDTSWFEGSFEAEYDGLFATFEVSFDLTGSEHIHIKTHHFPVPASKNTMQEQTEPDQPLSNG